MKNFIFKKLPIALKKSIVTMIVWDFDGTFYQSEELANYLKANYLRYLNAKKKVKISFSEFDRLSEQYGSWSKAVARMTSQPESLIITTIDENSDKLQFIRKNLQMVELISQLATFRHIILTNSTKEEVIKGLQKIGFLVSKENTHPFERIIDRNDVRCLKPDIRAFQYVHNYTNLPKFRHLMIGDSYEHDLFPAKQYGFFAIHISEVQKVLNTH